MDLVKEAIFLGFSGAAVMDTKELVFVPEYRTFCEENLCGCYNVNPACPPESGTAEEMKQRALQYEKTLVLQTMQEDMHDSVQYKKDKLLQNKMTEELAEKMKAEGKTDILIMSAGPYKHNSCMSAYCVDAQKMADAAGMLCCHWWFYTKSKEGKPCQFHHHRSDIKNRSDQDRSCNIR